MGTWIGGAAYSLGFIAVALAFLALAKKTFDHITPYSVTVQVTERDNPALGAVLIGYVFGVVAVLCGAFSGHAVVAELTFTQFMINLRPAVSTAIYGLLLVLFSGWLNDTIILRGIRNTPEIVGKRNISVGVIMGCMFAGSGLIVAGAIHGRASLLYILGAYLLGQIALAIYALVGQLATSYDDREELVDNQNLACGIAFGGNMIAYAIVLMRGTMAAAIPMDMPLSHRFYHFLYYALFGVILLPLVRLINDRIFLPRSRLSDEIARVRNTNAGFLEAALAIAVGCIIFFSV